MVNGLLLFTVCVYRTTAEDVGYYFRGINPHMIHVDPHNPNPSDPNAATDQALRSGVAPLSEYPDAGVWPLKLIDALTADNEQLFLSVFAAVCVVLSGLYLWFLLGWGGRYCAFNGAARTSISASASARSAGFGTHDARRSTLGKLGLGGIVLGGTEPNNAQPWKAAWFWILYNALAGPILLTRLDLLPGLTVAVAMGLLLTRPRFASLLLAYAGLAKLWPGVLASALVGRFSERSTWVRLGAYFLSLGTLASITIVTNDLHRLISPISYQGNRGLQVESIFATPFIVARAFRPDVWEVSYAASKSFEITGPGVDAAMLAATAAMLALIVFAAGFALWRFLCGGFTHPSAVLFALLLVCLLIITNKVFSPQYIAWVAPLLALSSVLIGKRLSSLLLLLGLVVTGLTTLVFPVTYVTLTASTQLMPPMILLVRNIAMLVLTGYVAMIFMRSLRTQQLGAA